METKSFTIKLTGKRKQTILGKEIYRSDKIIVIQICDGNRTFVKHRYIEKKDSVMGNMAIPGYNIKKIYRQFMVIKTEELIHEEIAPPKNVTNNIKKNQGRTLITLGGKRISESRYNAVDNTIQCSVCHEWKEESAFHNMIKYVPSRCKSCMNTKNRH